MDAEPVRFGAGDYAVFAVMLAMSLAIGIFYAIRDRRSKEVQDYLMGGRKMSFWSVGISLSYTFASAVTILGIPAEIYVFGAMYFWLIPCCLLVAPVVTEIYIPLYCRLNLTSCYEYLQLRFNYAVRLIGTAAYIAQTILYLGVMIYAPSLALSQVSGFNIWAAIFSTGIVCTLYTTLGGLKAVVWSDVFQGIMVIIVLMVSMFMSAAEIGGWDAVWAANHRGNRLDFFVLDLDPRVRHTIWSLLFGIGFLWVASFAGAQSQVQRYLACRNAAEAKKSMYFAMAVSIFTILLCYIIGWVMYAYFENCDPLFNGQVSAADQLLPLMVMQTFRNLPGLPGLFIAGVFAGCLSTVSSGISAMACVTVQDFIRPFVKWKESTLMIVSKCLAMFFGLTSIGFACLSSILGGVLQTSLSMLGMLGGPILGMFTLGIVFPFVNTPGVISGFVVGLSMAIWIFVGGRQYPPGIQFLRPKPRSISGCGVASVVTQGINATVSYVTTALPVTPVATMGQMTGSFNTTVAAAPPAPGPAPAIADLYHVSYAYLAPIGLGATLVVGIIVSLLTCGHRHCGDVDPKLIVPLLDHVAVKYFFTKNMRRTMWCGVEHKRSEQVWSTKLEGRSNEAMDYYDAVQTTPATTIRRVDELPQGETEEEPSHV